MVLKGFLYNTVFRRNSTYAAFIVAGAVLAKLRKTNEDDMEEGNRFTGNLAKARAAGKKMADLDGDGDMEPVREYEFDDAV